MFVLFSRKKKKNLTLSTKRPTLSAFLKKKSVNQAHQISYTSLKKANFCVSLN